MRRCGTVLVGFGLLLGSLAAVAPAGAEPTTTTLAGRTLALSTTLLPSTGGSVTVTGAGFDPAVEVYLAVCAKTITPTDPLTSCVGGVIPDENTGGAWTLVSSTGTGPHTAVLGADGAFSADLVIDTPTGSTVDCVAEGCVLIARSVGADPASRPQDLTVPLTFTVVTSSTDAGRVIGPDSVVLPQARVGDQQTVVFSGYIPGEPVTVTVFSDPVSLPGISANDHGVVVISFPVTAALPVGAHSVQAVGSQSGLVGVAEFAVLDPLPVTATATTSATSPAATSSASAPAATTAAQTSSAAISTVPTTPSPASTTGAAAAPATTSTGSSTPWWLWATLALLVVAAGVLAAAALNRRRARELEQERLVRQRELEEQRAATARQVERERELRDRLATPRPTPTPFREPEMLSGRHTDPGALDERSAWASTEPRTTVIPPRPGVPPTVAQPHQVPPHQVPPTTAMPVRPVPPPAIGEETTGFWLHELSNPDDDAPGSRGFR